MNITKSFRLRVFKLVSLITCSIFIIAFIHSYYLNQEFVSALQTENFDRAEKLLDQGANPNSAFLRTSGKQNIFQYIMTYIRDRKRLQEATIYPIHLAAEKGQTRLIDKLLKKGIDVNERDGSGGTALINASYAGNYLTCDMLLKNGADANIYASDDTSALRGACMINNTKLIELLIPKVKDVNHSGHTKETPFSLYIFRAYIGAGSYNKTDINIIKNFLAAGSDINLADINGYTPLFRALDHHDYKLAKILIEHGADIDIKISYGMSSRDYLFAHYEDTKVPHEILELQRIVLKRQKR